MTIDDGTIREQARRIILDHAKDIEYLSIGEMIADLDEFSGLPEDEFDRAQGRIDKMIRNGTVTVTFPGDPDPSDALAAAYRERAHLVALLATWYPSHIGHTDPAAPDWAVVTVELPTGQACWHVATDDMDLFRHVQSTLYYARGWDGHTTDEKYQRIVQLVAELHPEANLDELKRQQAERGAENAQALKPLLDTARRITDASGSTS
jgi:hypothetical protein